MVIPETRLIRGYKLEAQENSDRYFLAVTALYGVGWNVLLKVHSSLLPSTTEYTDSRRARLKQVPNKVLWGRATTQTLLNFLLLPHQAKYNPSSRLRDGRKMTLSRLAISIANYPNIGKRAYGIRLPPTG